MNNGKIVHNKIVTQKTEKHLQLDQSEPYKIQYSTRLLKNIAKLFVGNNFINTD